MILDTSKRLVIASALVVCLVAGVRCQQSQTLDPFTSVVICANGDVGFEPSTDSSYSFALEGNEELFGTIEAGARSVSESDFLCC